MRNTAREAEQAYIKLLQAVERFCGHFEELNFDNEVGFESPDCFQSLLQRKWYFEMRGAVKTARERFSEHRRLIKNIEQANKINYDRSIEAYIKSLKNDFLD